MNQDRNEIQLLFGLLALQNDLLDRDALVAAFQAWSRDRGRSLADHLVDRGALEERDRQAVDAMVTSYIRRHGDDPEKSLAAFPVGREFRGEFLAASGSDLEDLLGRIGVVTLPTEAAGDGDRTATYGFEMATEKGTRFRLLRPHARGGIGQVGVALDTELNREVALKEIQPRLADDPDSRGRFLLEAEITGRLEHPGVIPVYGLGTDGQGRPYYAMRLIRGDSLKQAIDRFHAEDGRPACDRSKRMLALRELLNRFVAVCNAVGYAHSRGVIHRDLKPSNVMLGPYGETLVVDWGLAKVVGRDAPSTSTEATLRPTPASGSGPVSGETQAGTVVGTAAYMSPEQAEGRLEAIGPSSDVYSLGATLYCLLTGKPPFGAGDVAEVLQRVRRGDFPHPRAANSKVPAGLEAIVLRAMAARSADRYDSAQELAGDVEHWLADEPVSAYREPLTARAWRWARRHRTGVSVAVVLLIAAVVGLSVGTVLLQHARLETEYQRQAAVNAGRKAEAINRFLIDGLLKQADPVNNPAGGRITVAQLLDKAAATLDERADLGEEVETEIRAVVGHAYEYLGAADKAAPHYSRAWQLRLGLLGTEHAETLSMRNRWVWAIVTEGGHAEAESLAESAFVACSKALGEAHAATADAANNLAEVRMQQARFGESVELRRTASEIAGKVLGPDDNLTLEIDNNLAVSLVRDGKPAEAVPILKSIVDRRRRSNPRHPELATALGNLGSTLAALGQFKDAEAVLAEAIELGQRVSGPDATATLSARNSACYALEGQQRWDEAERGYKTVLADRLRVDGGAQPSFRTQRTLAFLARLYAKRERWPEAARRLSEIILAQHPDPRRAPDSLAATLADALTGAAEPARAGPLLEECREALNSPLWAGDWLAAEVSSRYGDCLRRQGKFAEAEPILIASARGVERAVGVPPWGQAAARKRVAELYQAWGKPAAAADWR